MDNQRPYRNPSPPPPSPTDEQPSQTLNVFLRDSTLNDTATSFLPISTSPLPVLTDLDVFLPVLPSPRHPPKKIDDSLNIPLQPIHNIFDNDILNLDNIPNWTPSNYTPDKKDFLLNTYNLLTEDVYIPNSAVQTKLSRPAHLSVIPEKPLLYRITDLSKECKFQKITVNDSQFSRPLQLPPIHPTMIAYEKQKNQERIIHTMPQRAATYDRHFIYRINAGTNEWTITNTIRDKYNQPKCILHNFHNKHFKIQLYPTELSAINPTDNLEYVPSNLLPLQVKTRDDIRNALLAHQQQKESSLMTELRIQQQKITDLENLLYNKTSPDLHEAFLAYQQRTSPRFRTLQDQITKHPLLVSILEPALTAYMTDSLYVPPNEAHTHRNQDLLSHFLLDVVPTNSMNPWTHPLNIQRHPSSNNGCRIWNYIARISCYRQPLMSCAAPNDSDEPNHWYKRITMSLVILRSQLFQGKYSSHHDIHHSSACLA